MKKPVFFLYLLLPLQLFAQAIPEGYILQYEQNFTTKTALSQYSATGNGEVGISTRGSETSLRLLHDSTLNEGLKPLTALIKGYIFGDFILEFDAMLSEKADSTNGFFVLFSYRDTANYYLIRLASSWFDPDGGIYINHMNKNSVVVKDTVNTWKLSEEKWTHFRMERNITGRTVKFYCSDMKNPVMQTSDPRLVMGYLGFGSSGGILLIDNIRIWAPTYIPGE